MTTPTTTAPSAELEKLKDMLKLSEDKQVFSLQDFNSAARFDTVARQSLIKPNTKLEQALANSHTQDLPPISVLPLAGQHLSILAQAMGAKSVLEIGTLGGYSSICFAQAGAHVTSIEINPHHHAVATSNVSGLPVDIILGSAEDILPRLVKEGKKFDMVFIDADFDNLWHHFDYGVKLARKGGCVWLDDVVASMWKNEQGPEDEEGILMKVGGDERVKATFCPVVVSHEIFPAPLFNGYILAVVDGEE